MGSNKAYTTPARGKKNQKGKKKKKKKLNGKKERRESGQKRRQMNTINQGKPRLTL